ncbi:retrovirus-related Pol polyprotein from type-1 retrotransposable element R1, partial [Halyomorpha halys]|uniref:retrovirus-related Pol polyprotein from type-1 retrotransposable element R1 n=1 Tax=Halyomorpha halys TaxID=286706 RepID=UPI0034D37C25
RVRPVPWWTPALTQLKKEYYRARRRYQECREESRHRYRVYRNGVRFQKKKSWDEFIVEETEKNPWGIPYRVALGKVKPLQVMAAIRVRGVQATTLEEAAKMYIDYTYPRDDPSQDSAEDGMVRRTTLYPPGTDLCPPWDIWDLRLAVDRQRIGGAPGLDSIDAAILKNSAPYIEEELLDIFNECLDKGYFPNKWRIADLRLLYKGGSWGKRDPAWQNLKGLWGKRSFPYSESFEPGSNL